MPEPKQELTPRERFWTSVIRSHKENLRDERAGWDVLGRTYRGSYWHEDRAKMEARPEDLMDEYGIEHEVNYLFGFTDTLVANVCPPKPQVTIRPRVRRRAKEAAHREKLSNDYMKRAKAGRHLRRCTALACVYPRAFLKAFWDHKKKRPVLRSLKPHTLFYDTTAEAWEDIRYIIEAKPITRQVFESRLRRKGTQGGVYRASAIEDVKYGLYPQWLVPQDQTDKSNEAQVVRDNYQWTTVYEVYDLVTMKYYHYLDGDKPALYEGSLPWKNLPNPFKLLSFHDNLDDLGGMSDGQLVFPTTQRINEMSSLRLHHAKTSIPVGILNAKHLDDPEAFQTSLDRATSPGQYAILNTKNAGIRLDEVFTHTPSPTLNFDFDKSLEQLISNAEWLLAMPANQRGQASATDVATDIAAIDGANKTRNGDRQEQVYDLAVWTSTAFLALFAEKMPEGWEEDVHIGGTDTTLTPVSLGFMDVDGNRIPFDPEAMDTASHAFNAESLNTVAQFRKLQVLIPQLVNNPHVDQRKLTVFLLRMAHMEELLAPEGQAQAIQQAQAAEEGGVPQAPGAPAPDLQVPPSDAASGAMEGGQVDTGEGDAGPAGAAGLGINI